MRRYPAQKSKKKNKVIGRNIKKTITRVLLIPILFLVSLGFFGVYFTLKYVNKSFAMASFSQGEVPYDIKGDTFPTLLYVVVEDIDKEPINIKTIKFIVFDRINDNISTYIIPAEIKYDIAGRYGEEELSKTIALGGMNSDDYLNDGIKVLKNTTFKIFGFNTDKFLVVSEEQKNIFDEMLSNGTFLDIVKIKDIIEVSGEFKTDMTFSEFYNLFSYIKSLPNERLNKEVLNEERLLNPGSIDQDFSDYALESPISQENKSISILNGSNYPGVATLVSRLVKNNGGRVVAIGNSDQPYSNSIIIAENTDSLTCRYLSKALGIPNIVDKNGTNLGEHEIDRSDIVVILGFDTSEQLY